MKASLIILSLLAAVCMAQHPCLPSPPQNLRIADLGTHSIGIEFEDPDDLERCPIASYHHEIEKVPVATEIVDYSAVPDRTHYHEFILLHSDTVYKISVTAISTFDVFSHPATIEGETLRE
ncbi:uncharacterized protein [Macrobrachium rosenbergii]|uniref:uncharacterized protein n=1 Tax=Macrobrachium rosenbergii TaxID=79674 RepID=UPI0034D6A443